MKIIILITLFSTVDNPAPHFVKEHPMRAMDTMEQCLKTRNFRYNYWEIPEKVKVTHFCMTLEVQGYDEALEAFKRQIGDMI